MTERKGYLVPPKEYDVEIQTDPWIVSHARRWRVRSARRLADEQANFTAAQRRLWKELAELESAKMGYELTIAQWEDLPEIIQTEKDKQAKEAVDASEALKEAKHQANIRDMERQRDMDAARAQHRQKGYAVPGGHDQEQEEFDKDLHGMRMAAKARMATETEIAEYIKRNGGEENLTKEQKGVIERLRRDLEQHIKDSGYE